MKRYITLVSLLISLLISSLIAEPEKIQTINIGVLTALTGPSAIQGVLARDALLISLKDNQEKMDKKNIKINLIIGDTQRKGSLAISEFSRMLEFNSILGVVAVGSPIGMAINPRSKQNKIPIIGLVGHQQFTKVNQYAFGIWPETKAEGIALANKFIKDDYKKVAIISAEDEWLLSLKKAFLGEIKKTEIEIVYDQDVKPEQTDFLSEVTKLKHSNPDAIFVNVNLGHSGILLKKIKELGIKSKVIVNYFGSTEHELKVAGNSATNIIKSQIKFNQDQLTKLAQKYQFKDFEPSTSTYIAYVSMEYIIQTILDNDGPKTSEDFYKALLKKQTVNVLGEKIMIKNRIAQYEFEYKEYVDGYWE